MKITLMNESTKSRNPFEARSCRNTRLLMVWTFAWVLTVALSTFGPRFLWDYNTGLSALAILLNIGIGIGMIWANKVFLRDSDEMQRKIQLDSMAVALGVTLVGGIAYSTMDQVNLISGDAEIGFLIMLMAISYIIALLVGRKRYL